MNNVEDNLKGMFVVTDKEGFETVPPGRKSRTRDLRPMPSQHTLGDYLSANKFEALATKEDDTLAKLKAYNQKAAPLIGTNGHPRESEDAPLIGTNGHP